MILSSNSIEFALLTMAAMQARAPVGAGIARLFSDEPGPRQAALRVRPHQAGPGVRAERRDLCRCARRPRVGRRPAGPCRQGAAQAPVFAVERAGRNKADRCGCTLHRGHRAQDGWQVPVHLGQHRHAQGGDQYPGDDVRQHRHGPDGAHPGSPTRRRPYSSTGCRGTTRWAATPPSRATSPKAARPGSTTASRCPACSRRRCAICAKCRRPRSPTCRRATPCWRRHSRRTSRWPRSSSRTSILWPTAALPCRATSTIEWRRWR